MHVLLIANGTKPIHLPALRKEVERLRSLGHEVRAHVTFEKCDARRMARDGAEAGAELVLAAGGDGTINEVANGLHDFLQRGGAAAPRLGIVPMGTANDLANAIGIPGSIEEAVRVAISGRVRLLNIATVNGECFLNVSTGGVGAEATNEAPQSGKKLLGPLAYAITGVKKLIGLEAIQGRFSSPAGTIYEGPFLLFAVGNSERAGGGNLLTPHADPTDHLLDLCIVKEVSKLEFTRLLPALRSGQHLDDPAVLYLQARRFTVDAQEELSVNADGEPLAPARSFEYGVSPHTLPVLVPAAAPNPRSMATE